MQNNNSKPLVPETIRKIGSAFLQKTGHLLRQPANRFGAIIFASVAAISLVANSQSTAPNIPAVSLAADPLYAASLSDKPALALALSVEFPTVGAQYVQTPSASLDDSYSNANEYLGYYDAESCYTYNNAPTEIPGTNQTISDYKRFDRIGAATERKCLDSFSGNFLNWASNSAIDMLRLAITGGDRHIDTPSLTILQRAYIPNGDPICMWNSSNFPAKQLKRSGGSSGSAFFGAIPTAMATAAGQNDIFVANTLNRIYFGTTNGGGCGNTSSYNLGGPTVVNQIGTISSQTSALPTGMTQCASENGTCSNLNGTQEIWYGAGSNWKVAPATGTVSCSNAVFGDPIVGTAKKCYSRAYTGSWTPTNSASTLNSDGFFYARVQVCNSNSSDVLQDVRDYGLCKGYPNGNYKPTGVVQKYSDQLRLAAFGYLMDQTASYNTGGRYGGVLRAPMKFVGGKTYDTNGVDNTPTGGNPAREWNENTGVFIVNPDNDTNYGKSGVVTYLNQFGRTGPVLGRYKKYDPVGELHYEALRYLQGLQPSADAISGIAAEMYDGFPVSTTWTDPYANRSSTADYSCLKSNIVVIGDINTHDGNRLPTADTANNIPDISYWRGIVQSFEKNQSVNYLDGQGTQRTTGNPNGANNSVPTGTSTSQIMGSAYWAHTHDIRGTGWTGAPTKQRPGLRVKTFVFDVNEYAAQNNANTRHFANQFFMAAKYGGFETDPSNMSKNPFNTWGNPFKQESGINNNYVWQDTDTRASRVGEANTYFLQSDARSVLSAFDDIFSRASTMARSIAGAAAASSTQTQAGNMIYQGAFDTSDWSGDVLAFAITGNTSSTVSIATTATWSAATQMASKAASARNIIIGNVGATANPVAAPFSWATPAGVNGIETGLRTSLDLSPITSAADGLAQDRLDYLRGVRTKEGTAFRTRNKLLGDVVNSGVVYSGAPTTSISSSSYTSFYNNNKSRTAAVFVGANDGMLHAFKASDGEELFAYIPSWLGSKLNALTSSSYVNSHQNYVDSTPVVAEAEVGSTWKTVLVSGTGAGGRGVFALDVTNPAAFDANKVMWEFTQNDDLDMGYVVGKPQILKLRTSAPGTTAAYKWFAVVASGVNSYVPDSAGHYGSGNPALFLLDLSKPAGTAWAQGTNYYKISFPIDSTLSTTKATGVINFSAALGNAREATQIYAGDLHGNLWKLDFSLHGSTNWEFSTLSSFHKGSSTQAIPLFIAKDASGNVQPITMAPSISYGPVDGSSYVMFGTGKYLEISDKSSTQTQSVYMIYDDGTSTLDSSTPATSSAAISGRGRLQAGTVTAPTASTAGSITFADFTLGRATSDTDTTQRSGWYFNLTTSGERQIKDATVFGTKAIFSSLIPGATGSSASSCSASGGSGNRYIIDIPSGDGTSAISTVGIMGEPLILELTEDVAYTDSDNTGRRIKTVKKIVITQGSEGIPSTPETTTTTVTVGRLSWRQIFNYLDLKNAP